MDHDEVEADDREERLRVRLAAAKTEHRALDLQIGAFDGGPLADQLELRRLKKKKLALRDEIARIEDELFPDIIA